MLETRILVAAGEPAIVSQLLASLEAMGCGEVRHTSSSGGAISIVSAWKPSLVLMDIELDGSGGIEAAAGIQAIADVPIVYLASRVQDAASQQALNTSPYGYLLKPVSDRELAATIRMALQRHLLHCQLRDREQELRTLVANVPGIVYRCALDPPWPMSQMSHGVLEMTGWRAEDFLEGRIHWSDIVHPDDLESLDRDVAGAVDARQPYHVVYRIVHKDGQIRWVEESGRGVCIEGDRPDHLDGILMDITESRLQSRAAAAAHAELEAIYSSVPMALMVVEKDRRVTKLNQAAHGLADPAEDARPSSRAGEVFKCLNALDDPRGCGFGTNCQFCAIRDAVNRTSEDGRPRHFIEAWLPVETEEGVEQRCLLISTTRLDTGLEPRILVSAQDITGREGARLALEKSEEKYRTLFENMLDGFAVHQIITDDEDRPCDYRFLSVNPAFESVTGLKAGEIMGRRVLEVMPGLDAYWIETYGKVVLSCEPVRFERWVPELNKWFDVYAFALDGMRFATVVRDTTERKIVELQYQGVWERSIDPMRLVDMDGRFVRVNDAFVRLFGKPREELIGEPFDCIYDEKLRPLLRRRLEALKTREVVELREEVRAELWDGRQLWLDISTGIIEIGSAQMVLSIMRDVTERRRNEENLVKSERRFAQAAESTREMIWEVDQSGLYTYVSDAVTRMLGYSPEEIVNKIYYYDLHPEQGREEFKATTQAMFGRGEPFRSFINKMTGKDGRVIEVATNAAPVFLKDGRLLCYQGTDRDVTEERQAEVRLLQAGKMESVGRLAGGVAHDFNNLLTVINGYGQLALDRVGVDHPVRAHLEEICKAGERAASLTRQLLAFGRKQVLNPKLLELNEVLMGMDPMIGRLVGEDIALRLDPNPDAVEIYADQGQVEQVVMNLVVNARDAMPEGGELTIRTECAEWDDRRAAQHPGAAAGRYAVLSVSDTGTGMDEATRQRVFEPFFTTKDVGQGTGLGLSIVHGIVEQSGGFVEIETAPGKGTTFTVYFPSAESPDRNRDAAPAARAGTGRETVLVVEDEVEVRKYAAQVLAALGYRVIQAESAGQALLLCEKASKPIDLLLTDVVMPLLNGKELAARLRPLQPDIRILYMSGYADDSLTREDLAEQGAHFIQKPFGPNQLAEAVRAALDLTRPG
ncbi:MAG: PAS domain S-box protein [Bryobacteraceae bacterium]|nr:PAS domain S-box protein [Bryobacteraceae bacterium]